MTDIHVGDIIELRSACYFQGQVSINTGYMQCTEVTGDPVTTEDLADTAEGNFAGPYKAAMSTDAHWQGLSAQRIFPLPRTLADIATANEGPGAVSANTLPGQVTGLITLTTPLAGPKYRGRRYIGFPTEDDLQLDGIPNSAYVLKLNAIALLWGPGPNPFANSGLTGTAVMQTVLWHRDTQTFSEVTGTISRKKWATQKRRGNYGAPNVTPF